VVSGQWPVVSGQWPVVSKQEERGRKQEARVDRWLLLPADRQDSLHILWTASCFLSTGHWPLAT